MDELLPDGVTQRSLVVGDVPALLTRGADGIRLLANTCRHRGHELLAEGESASRRSIVCPYHAWAYDLDGALTGAPGLRDLPGFDADDHALVELPYAVWCGWVFGHGLHERGHPAVPPFEVHLGALGSVVEPYAPERLALAARHTLRGGGELEGRSRRTTTSATTAR